MANMSIRGLDEKALKRGMEKGQAIRRRGRADCSLPESGRSHALD